MSRVDLVQFALLIFLFIAMTRIGADLSDLARIVARKLDNPFRANGGGWPDGHFHDASGTRRGPTAMSDRNPHSGDWLPPESR